MQDTSPHHGERVCPVTWESYGAWSRCGPDKVVLSNSTYVDLWPPSAILTFEIQDWVLCASHIALSWWTFVPRILEIPWRINAAWIMYSPIKQSSFLYLTYKCDLDIRGTGLGLVCDTQPQHGERLCQVSWKSYDAWSRCGLDKHWTAIETTMSSSTKPLSFHHVSSNIIL